MNMKVHVVVKIRVHVVVNIRVHVVVCLQVDIAQTHGLNPNKQDKREVVLFL